jgi:hypothetical protein
MMIACNMDSTGGDSQAMVLHEVFSAPVALSGNGPGWML